MLGVFFLAENGCVQWQKKGIFEDSFRVRSSSICLDLRLDLSIILFTIFG